MAKREMPFEEEVKEKKQESVKEEKPKKKSGVAKGS